MNEVDIIAQLEFRVAELERQNSQMLQLCQVTHVYTDTEDIGHVDVAIPAGILKRRPFLTQKQGEDTTVWLPSVGELGLLLSPSGDYGNSIFLHGIAYNGFPVEMPTGTPDRVHQVKYRDGIKLTIDTETHSVKWENGTAKKTIDTAELKNEIGTNQEVLNAIAKTIVGAILYATGITNLQSPVGPVFFAPAPPPAAAPSPPAGSEPNSDGNVTKTPPSDVDSVDIRTGSSLNETWTNETMSLVITTPIPVVTPVGPGSIAAGTYPIALTGTPSIAVTDGNLNLTFPARTL